MNYQETLDFLYTQLPVYQKEGAAALNKKLDKTLDLCSYLGNPQSKFKSIHVAGTNGKGSVSHMISAVLQKGGFKTGLYTSPHLKSFTERIKINGIELPPEYVVEFVRLHQVKIKDVKPSFFEITVVMAFDYFAREKVDYAVIEVGLGGRFDSTNVILPELSVITNISLDHTAILGYTIKEIAFEKAGIIKKGIPVVVGEFHEESFEVFDKLCNGLESPLVRAFDKLDGTEDYEDKNLNTAAVALNILLDLNTEECKHSLIDYKRISDFKGRWQTLNEAPKVVCDTGHNVAGVKEVLKKLNKESFSRLTIIWGMVNDKDHDEILSLLPKSASYVFVSASINRMLDHEVLRTKALRFGLKGECIRDVNDALEYVKKEASKEDFILIGGSTFVVAELNSL